MPNRSEFHGPFEMRYHDGKDGKEFLDEVVMHDKDGNCVFHLEQMDDQNYWMGLYGPGGWNAHVWIGSKNHKTPVEATLSEEPWQTHEWDRLMYPKSSKSEQDEALIMKYKQELADEARKVMSQKRDFTPHPDVVKHWEYLSSLSPPKEEKK